MSHRCCERHFGTDRFDFNLDDGLTWRAAYGKSTLKCLKPKPFFHVRMALTAFWLIIMTWFTWHWTRYNSTEYYFIYGSHLAGLIELLWLFMGAFSTYRAIWGDYPDGTGEDTPWFVRFTWFLYSFVPVISFLVAFFFWYYVWEDREEYLTLLNVLLHGGNFLVAMVDVMISRQPLYLAHVYVPLLIAAAYVAFTYVYHRMDGVNERGEPFIYPQIDWRDGDETGNLVGVVIIFVIPIAYCLLLCLLMVCCRCVRKEGPYDYES